jgi:Protein of unknown function (DUF3106)
MTCQAFERSAPHRLSVLAALFCLTLLASLNVSAALAQAVAETPDGAASSAESLPIPTGMLATPIPATITASAPQSKSSPAPAAIAPDWQSLSRAQKQLLAPLEPEWNGLDASRKSKWLELAARYPGLPADEQQRVQERLSSWAKLSPAERQQARLGFQVARQLKADERQAKWEAYQALPAERRQEFADKAAQKTQPTPSKAKPGKTGTANLVPIVPKTEPELPLGPTVLQAKPGATTLLINQGQPLSSRLGKSRPRVAFNAELLDSKTLLPKPATRRASDAP